MNKEDLIRIINKNETLEKCSIFLNDITYRTRIRLDSMTNIYQILHKPKKVINTKEHNDNINDIEFKKNHKFI